MICRGFMMDYVTSMVSKSHQIFQSKQVVNRMRNKIKMTCSSLLLWAVIHLMLTMIPLMQCCMMSRVKLTTRGTVEVHQIDNGFRETSTYWMQDKAKEVLYSARCYKP